MKQNYFLAAAAALALAVSAQAQTTINITGATAFRAATINSIVNGYGGTTNVRIVHSNSSTSNYTSANAISFRGNFGDVGDTIIRCRFSGSTEGIRDLVGDGTTPNDVFFYPDSLIPPQQGPSRLVARTTTRLVPTWH
jgi:hypothetical protein